MSIPQRAWFWMQPPSDMHGLGHIARVMTWASVLTRATNLFEPTVWAAACHDLRRHDDGSDPAHGRRAGAWVRNKLPGKLRQPPATLERVALACDWHVCGDSASEFDDPVLWYLKDADGLDRVRLYDLDVRYLRHPETLAWTEQARVLYQATQDLEEPALVWRAAVKLDLPMAELLAWVERQTGNLAIAPQPDDAEALS